VSALNLVIFGPPGAGKGTQSAAIKDTLELFHLSTGDMLREAIKNGTPTGLLAKQYTEKGALVPDEVVIKVVDEKVASLPKDKGVLFDGFPRTLPQAKALDEVLESNGRKTDGVININVPDAEIISRLTGRRMCIPCNLIYHVTGKPPKQEGVCDSCGQPITQRKDDTEEVILNRLKTYHAETAPVLDYYRAKGLLKDIDGTIGLENVTKRIIEVLK
jgi:adenylate kinase